MALAELSLTVPIVNTLAFLFTVLGDWWVDGKVIDRSTSPTIFTCLGHGRLTREQAQSQVWPCP